MASQAPINIQTVIGSLRVKGGFSGSSFEAPSIVEDLDDIVDLGLAPDVLDSLEDTIWAAPKRPWSMSQLYKFAEKLRTTDLQEYLRFIDGLRRILEAIKLSANLASLSTKSAPPASANPGKGRIKI